MWLGEMQSKLQRPEGFLIDAVSSGFNRFVKSTRGLSPCVQDCRCKYTQFYQITILYARKKRVFSRFSLSLCDSARDKRAAPSRGFSNNSYRMFFNIIITLNNLKYCLVNLSYRYTSMPFISNIHASRHCRIWLLSSSFIFRVPL